MLDWFQSYPKFEYIAMGETGGPITKQFTVNLFTKETRQLSTLAQVKCIVKLFFCFHFERSLHFIYIFVNHFNSYLSFFICDVFSASSFSTEHTL